MKKIFVSILVQLFLATGLNFTDAFGLAPKPQNLEIIRDVVLGSKDMTGEIVKFTSADDVLMRRLINKQFNNNTNRLYDEKKELLYQIVPEVKTYMDEKGKGHSVLKFKINRKYIRKIYQENKNDEEFKQLCETILNYSALDLLIKRIDRIDDKIKKSLAIDLAVDLLKNNVAISINNAYKLLRILLGSNEYFMKYGQTIEDIKRSIEVDEIIDRYEHRVDGMYSEDEKNIKQEIENGKKFFPNIWYQAADSHNGTTLLMHAAARGNIEWMNILLQNKADIYATLADGFDIIDHVMMDFYSSDKNQEKILNILFNNSNHSRLHAYYFAYYNGYSVKVAIGKVRMFFYNVLYALFVIISLPILIVLIPIGLLFYFYNSFNYIISKYTGSDSRYEGLFSIIVGNCICTYLYVLTICVVSPLFALLWKLCAKIKDIFTKNHNVAYLDDPVTNEYKKGENTICYDSKQNAKNAIDPQYKDILEIIRETISIIQNRKLQSDEVHFQIREGLDSTSKIIRNNGETIILLNGKLLKEFYKKDKKSIQTIIRHMLIHELNRISEEVFTTPNDLLKEKDMAKKDQVNIEKERNLCLKDMLDYSDYFSDPGLIELIEAYNLLYNNGALKKKNDNGENLSRVLILSEFEDAMQTKNMEKLNGAIIGHLLAAAAA